MRRAEREAHDLMAEADPEHGDFTEQAPNALLRADDGRGITGTVGEEDAVGFAGEHFDGRRRGRHDLDLAIGRDELIEDRPFDPEVVRDHEVRRVGPPDGVRRGRRHHTRQVAAIGSAVGLGRGQEHVGIGHSERPRHRARAPDVPRQPARVDAGDGRDAVALEEAFEVVGRPPVRRAPGEVAQDDAATLRRGGLVVFAR